MKTITYLLLVSIHLLFSACNFMDKKEKQKQGFYDYYATSSTANGYPCEIIGGAVGYTMIPPGEFRSSWGMSSSSMVTGDRYKPLPDTIRLSYYSFAEDKFYQLKSALPQERIKELLEARYTPYRDNDSLRYSSFTVSTAPCGLVGVWMNGSAGWLQIGLYGAEEMDWDFATVFSDWSITDRKEIATRRFENMYAFVKKEITEQRFSSAYWEDLSRQYRWKLTFNDPGFEVYDYGADLINVERRNIDSNGNWLIEMNEKAIPSELHLHLKHDKDPLRYQVDIFLVEPWNPENKNREYQTEKMMNRNRELMDLFRQFYSEAGDEEVSLLVEFNEEMTTAKVKLKSASLEYEIPGCRLKGIYDSENYNVREDKRAKQ